MLTEAAHAAGWSVRPTSPDSTSTGESPKHRTFFLDRKGCLPVVGVQVDGDDNAFIYISIRTTSWDFAGERTDLHDCLSALLAAQLRSFSLASCGLWDVEHPVSGIETELYGRYLIIEQPRQPLNLTNPRNIDFLKRLLLEGINTFEHCFWQCSHLYFLPDGRLHQYFSYEDADNWAEHISKVLREPFDSEKIQANLRRSPTWKYYRSIRSGISVYHSPGLANFISALAKSSERQVIEGINGRMFLSAGMNNIISFKNIRLAKNVLSQLNSKMDCGEIAVVPLENFFVAASGHHVLLVRRDCGKNRFGDERERIRKRHRTESELLFPVSQFIWSEKVDDDKFEILIRELLVREQGISWVRKISPSRERDGGRDLIAEWNTPPIGGQLVSANKSPYSFRRVIVQCKTSKGSIGKSMVQDIGDTVDHYGAQGYFLVVSSWLSTTLTEHLEKRRSEGKFWVDWWTRCEIEERLRLHPDLVNRYPEVVKARIESPP